MARLFALLLALLRGAGAAQDAGPRQARRRARATSCAAWCARTRRSPTPTRRSRSTCATRSASSCRRARASARCATSWCGATATSCSTGRRSRRAPCCSGSGRSCCSASACLLLVRQHARGAPQAPPLSDAERARAARLIELARMTAVLDPRRAARRARRWRCCCGRCWSAPRRDAVVARRERTSPIYRDQLRELDADLAAGTLAPADYDRARARARARALLEDVAAEAGRRPRAGGEPLRWRCRGARACRCWRSASTSRSAIPAAIAARGRSAGRRSSRSRRMVERLAARLRENPDDVEGWKLLGRSYGALGRFPEAADAYAKAAARAPRDARPARRLRRRARHGARPAPAGRAREAGRCARSRSTRRTSRRWRSPAPRPSSASDFAGAAAHWERMLPLVPAGLRGRARRSGATSTEARAQGRPRQPAGGEARAAPCRSRRS